MPGKLETDWLVRHAIQHREDWERLLAQPWGRRLLFAFIDAPEYAKAHASTFDRDLAQQSYESGRRDVGLQLEQVAQGMSPDMYARMYDEATKARREFLNARRQDEEAAAKEEQT